MKSKSGLSIFLGITVIQIVACNPYATRRLNVISRDNRRDSIYVAYPIVKSRRQVTKDYFYEEYDASLRAADTLTNKVIRDILNKVPRVKYGTMAYRESNPYAVLMDSVLTRFHDTEYHRFHLAQKLDFGTEQSLIIIPYFIWTRSTEDYYKPNCGKVGYRDYVNRKYCNWTRSQTLVLMIDKWKQEVIYFRYSQWDQATISMPSERRVNRSFRKCLGPILRKVG